MKVLLLHAIGPGNPCSAENSPRELSLGEGLRSPGKFSGSGQDFAL